jgi:hypothetical protein
MNDDWRLRIELHDDGAAKRLGKLLTDGELENELERSFQTQVVVSVDGPEVFCYAGSREQAQAAQTLIARLAGEHGWAPEVQLTRWHPTAERWEDPDVPLPADAEQREREREARVADERTESEQQGYPEFEVRVELASHGDARALAERLDAEGIPCVRRSRYVLIGATDEDAAQALAERIRGELPADAPVSVEGNMRAIYGDLPPSPFSVLGGLGG